MTLQRGFLHHDTRSIIPKGNRLIFGIFAGLLFSLIFYALLYYSRELLRTIWGDPVYYDIMILTKDEIYFYNIICAFIATIFGQSICMLTWWHRPGRKTGVLRIVNDLWPLNFAFMGMFTGLFGIVGLLFFWNTSVEFGLYPHYRIYFILAIVVLFLQQWLSLNRLYKRKGIVWMLLSATIICILSFAISRINPTDYESFNQQMKAKNIYNKYYVDWPTVNDTRHLNLERYGYVLDGNIYVTNTLNYPNDKTIVFVMNNMNYYSEDNYAMKLRVVEPDSIVSVIREWEETQSNDPSYFGSPTLTYHLKINRNIPMSVVNKLKTNLVQTGVRRVRYAVLPEELNKGETFRMYDDWLMLNMFLPDFHGYSKDSLIGVIPSLKADFSNTMEIYTGDDKNTYILNGSSVDGSALKNLLKTSVAENPDYILVYYIRNEDIFQDYINVVSSLHSAIGELRASFLIGNYGREYPRTYDERRAAETLYPNRLFELPIDPDLLN